MSRRLAVLITAGAVLWLAAILAAPAAPFDRVPVARALVYGAASLVCHQRPARSFHLHGASYPVCARCLGLYLSGAIGALLGWFGRAAVPHRIRWWLAAAAVPTAVTVVLEWMGVAAPGNAVRAVAALPLGALAAWTFVRMLRADSSPTICATIG